MFTFSCAPSTVALESAASSPPARSRSASTAGPTPLSTIRPFSTRGSSPPTCTSPSGDIAVTGAAVRICAPAARAARSSSLVTRPIPPTGTSQSPVPPPMTWYRKHRFCRRDGSSAAANVPIRPSVSTMPRAISDVTDARTRPPSGCSTSASHRPSSPHRALISGADGRGEVIDGKVAAAAAPRRSDRSAKRRASCGSPVTRAKESAVACASAVSIRTPRSGWSGSGVYEEYRRRVNRTRSPRSSITWRGRRLTR